MKKLIAVLLVFCFAGLAGCGKPADMDENVYNAGLEALDAVDMYLDGKIEKEEAKAAIDKIYDKIEEMEVDERNSLSQISVQMSLSSLELTLMGEGETIIDVKNARNDLAEELGK